MPSYKLVYFNMRGRAELSRLIFAAAAIKYEDIRIEHKDWPAMKEKTPQKTLPVLDVDGKLLPQSMAIVRFLATSFGLDGKSNLDKGYVNAVLDTVSDLKTQIIKVFFEKDESKKEELRGELVKETVPKYLGFLESFLASNIKPSGFFVGDSLTVADLAVLDVIDVLIGASPNVLSTFPKLKANRKQISELPKIKDWVNKRPKTAM